MKNIRFKLVIALVGIILLLLAIYLAGVFYIKTVGIELKTDEVFDYSQNIEYFLQTDLRWGNDILGNSSYTLAQQGCVVTDVAMVLNYFGYNVDPGSLNEEFTANQVYTENGSLLWYKIEDLYPVEYEYKRFFSDWAVEHNLEDGVIPIVRVKYGDSGLEHWVLIVGADGSDFLIMDPLAQNRVLSKLSNYDKVYAYRTISPKSIGSE